MWKSYEAFSMLVGEALDDLPAWVRGVLENVAVVVEDWPTRQQLEDAGVSGRGSLLGLYEGIPQSDRTAHYGLVLPDKITLFRGPILTVCATDEELHRQVQRTVAHELAHHFGIDDERLAELDAY